MVPNFVNTGISEFTGQGWVHTTTLGSSRRSHGVYDRSPKCFQLPSLGPGEIVCCYDGCRILSDLIGSEIMSICK